MAALIPSFRIERDVLEADIAFIEALGAVDSRPLRPVPDPNTLLGEATMLSSRSPVSPNPCHW